MICGYVAGLFVKILSDLREGVTFQCILEFAPANVYDWFESIIWFWFLKVFRIVVFKLLGLE